MPSKKLELQWAFAKDIPALINKAHELGYFVSLGDAYRDERVFGKVGEKLGYGAAFSCHKIRLALDLNLYDKEGKYLELTEDHRKLGEWWEAQAPENCWGGRFNDGNHYSKTFEGMK